MKTWLVYIPQGKQTIYTAVRVTQNPRVFQQSFKRKTQNN